MSQNNEKSIMAYYPLFLICTFLFMSPLYVFVYPVIWPLHFQVTKLHFYLLFLSPSWQIIAGKIPSISPNMKLSLSISTSFIPTLSSRNPIISILYNPFSISSISSNGDTSNHSTILFCILRFVSYLLVTRSFYTHPNFLG